MVRCIGPFSAFTRLQTASSGKFFPLPSRFRIGEHEKLIPVQKALLDKHEGVINAFFSESYFLEVVPAGVAKDASLDKLLTMLDITSEELVACGDGMNDIPMLKYAGLAAVMEAYPAGKNIVFDSEDISVKDTWTGHISEGDRKSTRLNSSH